MTVKIKNINSDIVQLNKIYNNGIDENNNRYNWILISCFVSLLDNEIEFIAVKITKSNSKIRGKANKDELKNTILYSSNITNNCKEFAKGLILKKITEVPKIYLNDIRQLFSLILPENALKIKPIDFFNSSI